MESTAGAPSPPRLDGAYARLRVCSLRDRRCCVCSRWRSSAICIDRWSSVGVTPGSRRRKEIADQRPTDLTQESPSIGSPLGANGPQWHWRRRLGRSAFLAFHLPCRTRERRWAAAGGCLAGFVDASHEAKPINHSRCSSVSGTSSPRALETTFRAVAGSRPPATRTPPAINPDRPMPCRQ